MHKSIAVVGIGCIFPDAMDISEYWSNIVYGKDSIREIPDSYWLLEDYYDLDNKKKDKTYSKRAGMVGDIPFNAIEFGIMPKDLESISVDQLFALVVAKQALIDAGMYGKNAKTFDREKVGVILASGIGKTAFSLNTRLQIPKFRKILRNSGVSEEITEKVLERIGNAEIEWTESSNPGYLPNVVAGRVASRLNLYGTNCTVDAACASSLAALKYAVGELECGDCDIVLTGAVNLDCSEFSFVSFSKTPAISQSDKNRPFDQNSDGMILGDGVGMVVLKRLEDAERDGDKIYGVIKGIGASGDGRAKGIFAPSVDGQIKALKRAYENANVDPASISLIEAHGTGTKVGDKYELEALKKFFGDNIENHYIGLGSVKSQIGHTRLAAGMASFIKVMLALHHNVLPMTLHVENVSTIIKNTQFNVIDKSKAWIVNDKIPIRRAGISAFGFGGTNYHVVMEEYKRDQEQPYRLNNVAKTIVLSGRSNEEIIEKCQALKGKLLADEEVDFDNYYGESQLCREEKRIGFVLLNREDGIKKLSRAVELLESNRKQKCWDIEGFYYRDRGISDQDKIVTLFYTYQNQYEDMFSDVAMNYPEMRESFRKADNVRIQYNKKPISQIVYPFVNSNDYDEEELNDPENASFASATVSCGIYNILRNRGYKSDYFIGCELAEMVSLWVDGVITEEQLLNLIQQGCLKNTKQSQEYRDLLHKTEFRNLYGIVYSATTGERDPETVNQMKSILETDKEKSNYFEKYVCDAYEKGSRIFVEIGPDKILSNQVKKVLGDKAIEVITIDSETQKSSYEKLETALMRLHVLGVVIERDNYYKKLDDEIKEKFKKDSIRINPRIFLSEKKERLVRDAIYKNTEGEYSDITIEKTEYDVVDHSDVEQEYIRKELKNEVAIDESSISEATNTLNETVVKPQELNLDLVYEVRKLNQEALKHLFDSQKLQLDFFCEAIEKCSDTGKNRDEIVKNLYDYGEKNVIAYKDYISKQNREVNLHLNGNLNIDREEDFVTIDKKVGMRVMDVACKKISMKPSESQIKKGLVIVTLDKDGIAIMLCKELKDRGFIPVILNIESEKHYIHEYPLYNMKTLHEQDIKETIELIIKQNPIPFTGFIYTSSKSYGNNLKMIEGFEINKTVFLIAKYFYLYSEKELKEDEKKFFINVIRMDGVLGMKGISPNVVLGGLFGLGKSLCDEWKDTLVKTIDIQRECDNEKTIQYIMEELLSGENSFAEVGRDISGERYSLGLNDVKIRKLARKVPCSDDVFLVTGGSRGITAQCIIRLAEIYHCKFVILGRTVLRDDLELGTNFKTKRELQKAIIEQMGMDKKKVRPKEVSEIVNSYYAQIKILETLKKLNEVGSKVLYYACDVMNENEVKRAVEDAISKMGEITGFIHGAGVLADRYIHKKEEKDFYAVAGTKIFGLDACLKSLKMDKMQFLIFFSSVAAFFGNRGQSDYAMGNEVLNKMSYRLKNLYQSCKIISVNWGPWDGGMIDNSLKQSLADRDISVISIEEGIELFMEQFRYEQENNVSQVVVYDKRIF